MALSDFTPLQIETCSVHLPEYYREDVNAGLDYLTESRRRTLVGNVRLALEADKVNVDGEAVATRSSVLGKVLIAHSKCSPDVVDDSLLVQSVGKVNLRRDELRARRDLYEQTRMELAKLLNFRTQDSYLRRIGYQGR